MAIVYRNGRPYLYKSIRRNGKVTSEYRGCGPDKLLFDRLEAIERQRAEDAREDWKTEVKRMQTEERAVAEMSDRVDSLAGEALVGAGFHRHKRQWRKRGG